MAVQLSKQARKEAVAAIIDHFETCREERIGLIAASELLEFFLEEIAPSIHNNAVAKALDGMRQQITELDLDLNEREFPGREQLQRGGPL